MPDKLSQQPAQLIAKTIHQTDEIIRGVNILLKLNLIPRTPALSWQLAALKAENKSLKIRATNHSKP